MRWLSWASLALPFIAYVLCSLVSTGHLWLHAPPWGRNVDLLRDCAFLVCAVMGVLALCANLGSKRWSLLWLPAGELALTYLLFTEAAWFTRFLS